MRKPVDKAELMMFIAMTILSEIHGNADMEDKWSRDENLKSSIFTGLMSRDRYRENAANLPFADNSQQPSSLDKFWKIRRVFDLLNGAFQREFNMGPEIAVDETIMLWRGNHSLR